MSDIFDNKKIEDCFNLALENIIKHGDTDIFPYPFESRLFEDDKQNIINALMITFSDFEKKELNYLPI